MAKKGDRLTDFVTANWYNNVTRSVQQRTGITDLQVGYQNQYVTVRNHNTTAKYTWDAVSLDSAAIDYTQAFSKGAHSKIVFDTKDLSGSDPHNIAILQEPLSGKVGDTAQALICGSSWLRMPVVQASDNNVSIDGSGNLAYSSTGRIDVLRSFNVTDSDYLALVVIGALPQAGHYLYTLTSAMSSGSGTATIRNMADDTEIATSQTVEDTLGFFDGLASGRRGICILQGGTYYAIGPYVTDVQWDDPDLEYSKDGGTNWTNIDTAEDCT